LAEAVGALKQQARLALPAPAARPAAKPAASNPPGDPMWRAARQLGDTIGELERLLAGGPGQNDRATLMIVLRGSVERLGRLDRNLRQ
jgi:hypothetical protein